MTCRQSYKLASSCIPLTESPTSQRRRLQMYRLGTRTCLTESSGGSQKLQTLDLCRPHWGFRYTRSVRHPSKAGLKLYPTALAARRKNSLLGFEWVFIRDVSWLYTCASTAAISRIFTVPCFPKPDAPTSTVWVHLVLSGFPSAGLSRSKIEKDSATIKRFMVTQRRIVPDFRRNVQMCFFHLFNHIFFNSFQQLHSPMVFFGQQICFRPWP